MLTGLYSLGRVSGAWVLLAGWLICAAAYWIAMALLRQKRGGALGFLTAEVITDVCWAVFYYDGGNYVNRGVGSMYAALLWPGLLLICGAAVGLYSRSRS